MFKLFTAIESEVEKLGTALKGVFSTVHASVSEAAEFTTEELQAGVAEFLASVNGADFSISQAFEAGATYAAEKLKAVVAPVVAQLQPEIAAVEAVGSAVATVAPAVVAAVTADAPAVAASVAAFIAPAPVAAATGAVVASVAQAVATQTAPL